jgi:thiosulfate dehydrogenase (quinone) large subunit
MATEIKVQEPGFARWLFGTSAAAWIWLVVRIWLGYQWLHAGWEKVTGTESGWHLEFNSTSWLKSSNGLVGFINFAALPNAKGAHAAVNYGWYATFLRWMAHPGPASFFSKLVALGEVTIAILLILGLFTGIAAFLAGMLSMSFGLAGSAGVNPVFFFLEVLLILAWRNSGYYGLDRFVLPKLGTPWQRRIAVGPLGQQHAA